MSDTLLSDRQFRVQLRELRLKQYHLGREEFRLAAMRMFAEAENDCAVRTILKMKVDSYLTPEEIAERERMP